MLQWFYDFSTSAGLGGVFALVAAVIAYRGVTGAARTNRDAAMAATQASRTSSIEQQWWTNVRWAFDRIAAGGDPDNISLSALEILGALAPSEAEGKYVIGVLATMARGVDISTDHPEDLAHQDRTEGH